MRRNQGKSGAEATAAVKPLQGQMVTITEMDTDRYGRLVGLVEHDEKLINLDLVARGLAWFYPQYCRVQPLCRQIEAAEAREAKRGLWAGEPIPPVGVAEEINWAGNEAAPTMKTCVILTF
jgi:endonuclease YncB( thermonuclease family)